MGKVIDFSQYRNQEPDLDSMDKESLLAYLEQLRTQIEELDAAEPKNMNSEAYEEWGDLHEELEDRVDDILDRLDEME
jgi:hypothetical protein